MSPPATPVVLVGLTAQFGGLVSAKLKPEYEVIHFVSDLDVAQQDLKALFAGGEPTVKDESGVSTGNFSQLPRHVVVGKSFQIAELEKIREGAGAKDQGACWYWAEQKEGDQIIKPEELKNYSDELLDKISSKVADNMRNKFDEVIKEGKEGKDGIYQL